MLTLMPESESLLDNEDWDIVFQAYEEYPILAFILAQHLDSIRTFVEGNQQQRKQAIAGLNQAIGRLMPHTTFRDVGHRIYWLAVSGKLSPKQEETMRELGLIQ
jgi:hypothetical protein